MWEVSFSLTFHIISFWCLVGKHEGYTENPKLTYAISDPHSPTNFPYYAIFNLGNFLLIHEPLYNEQFGMLLVEAKKKLDPYGLRTLYFEGACRKVHNGDGVLSSSPCGHGFTHDLNIVFE